MEEGFSGLIAMDVEADGADFDSVGFAGITRTPPATSRAPSPAASRAPSPAASRAPSPAASRAPSPAASRAPSPAASRAPSPAASHAPSPAASQVLSPGVTLSSLSTASPSLAGKKRSLECVAERSQSFVGGPDNPTSKRPRKGLSMTATALLSILDPIPTPQAVIRSTSAAETNHPDNLSNTSPTVAKVKPAVRSPKWFRSALSMFQADENRLGLRWMELVAVWVDFEVKERYKERKKLSACSRPSVVEEWIRRARSPTWRPCIVDLAAFEKAFNLWWTELAVGRDIGVWENLRKAGLNGLVSLLAALFFWGLRVRDSDVDRIHWSVAVDDSLAAIREIIQLYHT